jgi:hypothetical protein
MHANRVDVTIEISSTDPRTVLTCRRCGEAQTLTGLAIDAGPQISEFTDTHLNCPPPLPAPPAAPSEAQV